MAGASDAFIGGMNNLIQANTQMGPVQGANFASQVNANLQNGAPLPQQGQMVNLGGGGMPGVGAANVSPPPAQADLAPPPAPPPANVEPNLGPP